MVECPICLNDIAGLRVTTPCSHTFCIDCVLRLHSDTCPMCRAPFPTPHSSSVEISVDDADVQTIAARIAQRLNATRILERAVRNGAAPRNRMQMHFPSVVESRRPIYYEHDT